MPTLRDGLLAGKYSDAMSLLRRGRVQTVGGEIAVHDLGMTLVHEHLFVQSEQVAYQWPGFFDEDEVAGIVAAKVKAAMGHGIETIVDPTVAGLGRDIRLTQRIVDETGIKVVAATGYYSLDNLPRPFKRIDDLVRAFVGDIENGIQGTQVKAAFIKCVTDRPGLTDDVVTVLRAAARAHRRTGVPIMTHAFTGNRSGALQLGVFDEEGVDPSCVLIGHCGDTTELDYLTEISGRGAYLGMDRYGLPYDVGGASLGPEERNKTIAEMDKLGLAAQLVISQDAVGCYMPLQNMEFWNSWDFSYVFEHALPQLHDLGVPDATVKDILSTNVHRWLDPVEPY
jgi:phosphotriesterase-related protein